MLIRIDPSSPVPLGDQVAASVRGGISDGAVKAGDRLPPARELAASLGINLHTVLRGYQQLRDEGLIELRRGRGALVADGVSDQRAELLRLTHELVQAARRLGLGEAEVLELVRAELSSR